jgi:fatty acid desaturase
VGVIGAALFPESPEGETEAYPRLSWTRLDDASAIWWSTRPLLKEPSMPLLWILVIALIILAVVGGAAVSSFLWLVLIVALIVAVFAFLSGRRAV